MGFLAGIQLGWAVKYPGKLKFYKKLIKLTFRTKTIFKLAKFISNKNRTKLMQIYPEAEYLLVEWGENYSMFDIFLYLL